MSLQYNDMKAIKIALYLNYLSTNLFIYLFKHLYLHLFIYTYLLVCCVLCSVDSIGDTHTHTCTNTHTSLFSLTHSLISLTSACTVHVHIQNMPDNWTLDYQYLSILSISIWLVCNTSQKLLLLMKIPRRKF